MLSEHWGAVEADYLATYGRELGADAFDPAFPLRRLVALVGNLPRGGPLHRALDPDWFWFTPELDFLALIVETLDVTSRRSASITAAAAGVKKPLDFGPPIRIPRPYDEPENTLTPRRDVLDFFGGSA